MKIKIKLEFKIEDFWIGIYWKATRNVLVKDMQKIAYIDFWICLLPCLPIHITLFNDI